MFICRILIFDEFFALPLALTRISSLSSFKTWSVMGTLTETTSELAQTLYAALSSASFVEEVDASW